MEHRAPLAELIRLAVPSALFTVLTNSYRIVDQYFVQRISVDAQAAIGSSIYVLIAFYAVFELVAGGAAPLVARATGANDPASRRQHFGAATFGAFGISGVLMVLGAVGAPWIVFSLGLEGQAAVECERYLFTVSITILPLVFTPLVDQVFLAMGHAKGPLLLHALTLALNLVLTPYLIESHGIVGAALASTASRFVATAIGYVALVRIIGLRLVDVRPAGLRRVTRIGLPITLNTLLYAGVYWMLLKTSVSPLGPSVNAALGIGFSALEGFTWPVFHGVSLGAASLVGRQLGARDKDAARRTVRLAFPITTALGVAASLAFYFAGEPLTGFFTDDPVVHAAAIEYATILAFTQTCVAWEALAEGVLAGAGDTKTVFWWSAPFNIVRVPMAWTLALPLGFGAAGIWWAINVTSAAKAFGKGWATYRGRWLDLEP